MRNPIENQEHDVSPHHNLSDPFPLLYERCSEIAESLKGICGVRYRGPDGRLTLSDQSIFMIEMVPTALTKGVGLIFVRPYLDYDKTKALAESEFKREYALGLSNGVLARLRDELADVTKCWDKGLEIVDKTMASSAINADNSLSVITASDFWPTHDDAGKGWIKSRFIVDNLNLDIVSEFHLTTYAPSSTFATLNLKRKGKHRVFLRVLLAEDRGRLQIKLGDYLYTIRPSRHGVLKWALKDLETVVLKRGDSANLTLRNDGTGFNDVDFVLLARDDLELSENDAVFYKMVTGPVANSL